MNILLHAVTAEPFIILNATPALNTATSSGRVLTDRNSGYYGPCGATHQADSDDEFLNGYIDDIYTSENENIPVIIWTDHGTDVHCTTNLDMSQWSTAKS